MAHRDDDFWFKAWFVKTVDPEGYRNAMRRWLRELLVVGVVIIILTWFFFLRPWGKEKEEAAANRKTEELVWRLPLQPGDNVEIMSQAIRTFFVVKKTTSNERDAVLVGTTDDTGKTLQITAKIRTNALAQVDHATYARELQEVVKQSREEWARRVAKTDEPKKPNPVGQPIQPGKTTVRIAEKDLLEQVRRDASAAEKAYRDRPLEVTGEVQWVHQVNFPKRVVSFTGIEFGPDQWGWVECEFGTDFPGYEEIKSPAGRGVTVTVRGLPSQFGRIVRLTDCTMVTSKDDILKQLKGR